MTIAVLTLNIYAKTLQKPEIIPTNNLQLTMEWKDIFWPAKTIVETPVYTF